MESIVKKAFEVKLYMLIYGLKEAKKEYSSYNYGLNYAYVFADDNEFNSWFKKYDIDIEKINKRIVQCCILIRTKNGTIIALKDLCDDLVRQQKIKKNLSQSQVDEIHARGNITFIEQVQRWENRALCVPGEPDRCKTYKNCHECLLEFASKSNEYEPVENYTHVKKIGSIKNTRK